MPQFSKFLVDSITDASYSTVVETGTYNGNSALKLAQYYKNVFTIEIDLRLYQKAARKFALRRKKNIVALHGDSRDVLRTLVPMLSRKGQKVVFWLDAHWSGDSRVDWKSSKWKGYGCNTGHAGKMSLDTSTVPKSRDQVPLEQEIMCVFRSFLKECVIYVDDFDKIDPATNRGLKNHKFQGEDWSALDFNKIFHAIKSRTILLQKSKYQLMIKLKAVA